jgi:hypothetical protein
VGNLPPGVEDLFKAAQPGAGPAPALIYPTAGTMFPPNIARLLFQWKAASGSVFQLQFKAAGRTFDVYTDGVHETCEKAATGGKCWESSKDTLLPYFEAAVGSKVELKIRALLPGTPSSVWESAPYTFFMGPAKVTGAIYYWSTTAQGIRRGTLDGRDAADYLTPKLADGKCVACHTLSRSGKQMTVSFPGDLLGTLNVVETVPPPITFGPPPFKGDYVSASWATISPDDQRVVVAGQGILSVLDVNTAKPIGAGKITLPDGLYGSMPDWAPDNQHLVFVTVKAGEKARHLQNSSIAWLKADGDTFTGYELIAESKQKSCGEVYEAYANPMFSPDSKWLAFSRANCESENDPTAEILLAPAAPNAPQTNPVLANTQVGDNKLSRLQNGMPTWAPAIDKNVAWIAFTSIRDYGVVLNEDSKTGKHMRQLWVAAVDLSKMGSGDPSYPAFRLPAQDLNENNHRPFWAIDVLPPDWVPPTVK